MYVLVVGNGYPTKKYPGLGIFGYDQAKALAAYGHKVVYVALDLRSVRRFRRFGLKCFLSDGIDVVQYSFPAGNIGYRRIAALGKFCFARVYKRIVKRFGKPDIIHAHFGEMGMYVGDFCKEQKIPLVLTEHSSLINRDEPDPRYLREVKKAYLAADCVLSVSTKLAQNIYKHTGIVSPVIHNVLSLEDFCNTDKKENNSRCYHILSAGNLVHIKGFDILIEAFAEFGKTCEADLTIMGGGPEEKKLRELTKELGIEQKVTFAGRYVRSEFAEALIRSDVFVLASRSETFGVVYVEAMAAGVPVIATRCGGPEDFVIPENGLLVPVDDVSALVAAMDNIYRNKSFYSANHVKESASKFSPAVIAEKLTEIYKFQRK